VAYGLWCALHPALTLVANVNRKLSDGSSEEAPGSYSMSSGGRDSMYPAPVTSSSSPSFVLRARPDRRAADRYVHSQPVEINGIPAVGCDISAKGIAVIPASPLAIGDVVRVTVAEPVDAVGPKTRFARVTRIDRRSPRTLVGLEFVR
jgi:hypothetical protein